MILDYQTSGHGIYSSYFSIITHFSKTGLFRSMAETPIYYEECDWPKK